jgi:hypothetical protein
MLLTITVFLQPPCVCGVCFFFQRFSSLGLNLITGYSFFVYVHTWLEIILLMCREGSSTSVASARTFGGTLAFRRQRCCSISRASCTRGNLYASRSDTRAPYFRRPHAHGAACPFPSASRVGACTALQQLSFHASRTARAVPLPLSLSASHVHARCPSSGSRRLQ